MSPSGGAVPACGRSALLMRGILQPEELHSTAAPRAVHSVLSFKQLRLTAEALRSSMNRARGPRRLDGEGEVEVLAVAAALAFELDDDEALLVVDEALARRLAAGATTATAAGHVGEVRLDLVFGAQADGRFGLAAGRGGGRRGRHRGGASARSRAPAGRRRRGRASRGGRARRAGRRRARGAA